MLKVWQTTDMTEQSIEVLVEAQKLARERRKQGKPVWHISIDVSAYFDPDVDFEDAQRGIVATLKSSSWYTDDYTDLEDIVDQLENAEDEKEFDRWWVNLYDLADYDRVWIKTFQS